EAEGTVPAGAGDGASRVHWRGISSQGAPSVLPTYSNDVSTAACNTHSPSGKLDCP
ncbi:hypothetical protein M9458_041641, partial [Cirrhinus mrigala]